jgi:DNA-binding response OmpR family regulator
MQKCPEAGLPASFKGKYMTHSKRLQSVLFVSKDSEFQQLGSIVLRVMGCLEVHICHSVAELAGAAANHAVDLILFDTSYVDGLEVLAALQAVQHVAAIPVLFMVPWSEGRHIAHYRSLGGIGAIHKPVELLMLPERIFEIWDAEQSAANGLRQLEAVA